MEGRVNARVKVSSINRMLRQNRNQYSVTATSRQQTASIGQTTTLKLYNNSELSVNGTVLHSKMVFTVWNVPAYSAKYRRTKPCVKMHVEGEPTTANTAAAQSIIHGDKTDLYDDMP